MNPINTPTGTSSVEDINASRNTAVTNGTNPYSGAGATTLSTAAGLAGTPPSANTPFDASAIGAGTKPLSIPTPTPSNNPATPIIAGAQASQDAAETQAEKNVASENTGVDASQAKTQGFLDQVKSILGMESDAQTARATGADQGKIDQANTDLTGINTQIADTNVKLRGVLDEIKGRGDISRDAQQGLTDNANAYYGRTLADLAIRQSAANTNIEALTKAADSKLALILAPLQTQLSYYKDFAIQNQDDLTKAEQTKVSQIIAEKQNIITQTQTQEQGKTDLLKTALTNGVKLTDAQTQGVLNAPDAASAAAYLASNGISLQNPLDQQSKLASISNTEANTKKTLQELGDASGTPNPAKANHPGYNAQGVKYTPAIAETEIRATLGNLGTRNLIPPANYNQAKAWWVGEGLKDNDFDSIFGGQKDTSIPKQYN